MHTVPNPQTHRLIITDAEGHENPWENDCSDTVAQAFARISRPTDREHAMRSFEVAVPLLPLYGWTAKVIGPDHVGPTDPDAALRADLDPDVEADALGLVALHQQQPRSSQRDPELGLALVERTGRYGRRGF